MASLKDRLRVATLELAEAERVVEAKRANYEALYRQVAHGKKRQPREEATEEDTPEPEEAPSKLAGKLPTRILTLVTAKTGAHTVPAIAEALKAEEGSVRAALYVLKKRKLVERVGTGEWSAKGGLEVRG